MKKPWLVSIGFLLLLTVSLVHANGGWPNWQQQATAYPEGTGEADVVDPVEDMTICYVYHDLTFMYFRAEFIGARAGWMDRTLYIYLDIDQNASTGGTGVDVTRPHISLHDLGADYRLQMNHPSEANGTYEYSIWRWKAAFSDYDVGDTYINIKVRRSDIGDPKFPIDILFVSELKGILETDYNPNYGHVQYPIVESPSVGGEVLPINTLDVVASYLQLNAPYILILSLATAATAALLFKKRRF